MNFDLIMVCPPWKRFNRFRTRGPCLSDNLPSKLERSIEAFEFIQHILRDFTADKHMVYVWVPGKYAMDCREYMTRMGYTIRGSFVWVRPKWKRGSDKKTVEFLMVCHKGEMPQVSDHYLKMTDSHLPGTVKHRLAKPESAYGFLEDEFPWARKLQVYGWTKRPGWTLFHKNNKKIGSVMKTIILLFVALFAGTTNVFAQQKILDIPALHQLVDESESENKLQVKAKNQQALATANEQANLTLLSKMKAMYRTLQQRCNTLGTAINIADIGIYATPMVERIVSNQSQIVKLVQKNPALIAIGYRSALQFTSQAKSLVAYVTGLTLSLGDVNQMKASDRKMLFDYVISELSNIQDLSGNMLNMMQYSSLASLLRAANPFQNFIDADKSIGNDIIQNAKYLK